MKIADLLARENALVDLKCSDKGRVLSELSRRAAAALGLSPERVESEILRREQLGSTGIGEGIALPHARLHEIERPLGVLARLKRPVEFDAIDQKPIDLVFLLISPNADQGEHLNALAAVARKLRDPERLRALRAAEDDETFYVAMTQEN